MKPFKTSGGETYYSGEDNPSTASQVMVYSSDDPESEGKLAVFQEGKFFAIENGEKTDKSAGKPKMWRHANAGDFKAEAPKTEKHGEKRPPPSDAKAKAK